jgi:hypothetical protein
VVIEAFWGDVLFGVLPLDGALRPVPLDAIEAAGGSLRCCVAEIY